MMVSVHNLYKNYETIRKILYIWHQWVWKIINRIKSIQTRSGLRFGSKSRQHWQLLPERKIKKNSQCPKKSFGMFNMYAIPKSNIICIFPQLYCFLEFHLNSSVLHHFTMIYKGLNPTYIFESFTMSWNWCNKFGKL